MGKVKAQGLHCTVIQTQPPVERFLTIYYVRFGGLVKDFPFSDLLSRLLGSLF